MNWSFMDGLVFSAIMTAQEKEFEKQQRLIKTQSFYLQCYQQITEDLRDAVGAIDRIVQQASPLWRLQEIPQGTAYLPLFCFDRVIHRQGRVSKEQQHLLDLYFSNLHYEFSVSSFTRAAIAGGPIEDFRTLMTLSEEKIGEFWVQLFRAYYKAGTQEDFQLLMDSMVRAMAHFSALGDLDRAAAFETCEEVIRSANRQIESVKSLPVTGLDWLAMIPIIEHKERMQALYDRLIEETDITEDIDAPTLRTLLDAMLLHVLCDMVMMTKKPKATKLQMIEDGVRLLDLAPIIDPREYVHSVATGTGSGAGLARYFVHDDRGEGGIFWSLLATLAEKMTDKTVYPEFLYEIFSILIQLEKEFTEKYPPLGEDLIALQYSKHITEMILDSYTDPSED